MISGDLAVLAPHTCSHCRRLVVDIRHVQPVPRRPQPVLLQPPWGLRFDFTYEDMVRAAPDGCTLCQYLKAELQPSHQPNVGEQASVVLGMRTEHAPHFRLDLFSVHFALYNVESCSSVSYAGDWFKVFTISGES